VHDYINYINTLFQIHHSILVVITDPSRFIRLYYLTYIQLTV
jgi:hypothetical protein